MQTKPMRDALIGRIYEKMCEQDDIFFLSADFGAPSLDKIREEFRDKFINVGIAEQNLINISAGLAIEGATVYAYAIAPFLTMRAYEQIRINLSLLSQTRKINVNLVGVGAGASYDVAGPTHHCLEDLSIMGVLPNVLVFSPSDWVLAKKFVDFSINVDGPKYLRLDGKPLPQIYEEEENISFEDGFCELERGGKICLVSTGYMTHTALKAAKRSREKDIPVGVVDVFMVKNLNQEYLFDVLERYSEIITMEEAFVNCGGLDSRIANLLSSRRADVGLTQMGFKDKYVFGGGDRSYVHRACGLDEDSIVRVVSEGALRTH